MSRHPTPDSKPLTLVDLKEGHGGILERIDLPSDESRRLMALGFLPESHVTAARRSPFGDPTIYRVDGSEIALRRETAARMILRSATTNRRDAP